MKLGVKVLGTDDLKRRIDRIIDDTDGGALETALAAGAKIVENDAKRRAPYRTGTLRRSITTEVTSQGRHAEAVVGSDVEYARRIELGFSGKDSLGRNYSQAAQPYLRPALDENQDAAIKEANDALRELILKHVESK